MRLYSPILPLLPFCVGWGWDYLLSYIVKELIKGTYKKVLILATGALLNPVMVAQKDTIPCISHAICLERCD